MALGACGVGHQDSVRQCIRYGTEQGVAKDIRRLNPQRMAGAQYGDRGGHGTGAKTGAQ